MNGKGSKRRPMKITQKQFEENWEQAFSDNIVYIETAFRVECSNCGKTYQTRYTQKINLYLYDFFANYDISSIISSCPNCDDNWEKTCGVDFTAFPYLEECLRAKDKPKKKNEIKEKKQ